MNMNRPFTRLFALMLAVVLALGCIGVTASAAADTKEVTIYFYYHQDDYVEKTILVDANATHVDMKTMNQAAKEAGIASGMGTWYIHGSYNNKILASENSDAPGVVWADVQCLYPMGDDTTVRPSVATNKEIRVNFYYEGTNTPVPGLYTMTVNQKTVLVDVQEVADLALENDLVLISLYRQIQDDQITAYVRQRLVNNPNATKVVNIYYYQQPYADGDAPAASSTVVVPINTDMIDTSIMETKAPTGWALEVFNSRIQNDANGEPSVSAYGYADGWPVERYSYEMCLQVPAIPDKTDAVESRFTVMDGQSFELPEVYTPAGWTFTGWLYNGELLEPGIYDVDYLIPATFDNINTTHYFQAQLKEVETWSVSVKVGSTTAKEVIYSATVQADKDKTPVLNDAMYDYIFAANGKEFVRSDYVSVPTGWSSVDSSRNIAYVRLVPKDEYSNKLSVSFYVEGNGYIVGSVNQITSFSYTDLKTDSTGSIRIPEVQAADGYEFKGWANERGQIVFAPGTNRVLISDIAHSYLQNDAYAHFYAVIVEEGEDEIIEWKLSVQVVDKAGNVQNTFLVTYETYKGQEPVLDNLLIAAIFADADLGFNTEDYETIGTWSVDTENAEASVTLTLKDEPETSFNVLFDNAAGTWPADYGHDNACTFTVSSKTPAATLDIPAPVAPAGYEFIGWQSATSALSGSSFSYETLSAMGISSDVTWVAQYRELENTFNVLFDNAAGTWPADYGHDNACTFTVSSRTPAESLDVPTVVAPAGYEFIGWQSGTTAMSGSVFTYETLADLGIDSEITFVAQYREIPETMKSITVTFDNGAGTWPADYGHDNVCTFTVSSETPFAVSETPVPVVPEDHTFIGWKCGDKTFNESDFTYVTMNALGGGEDITWVAQYQLTEKSITVTFDNGDGAWAENLGHDNGLENVLSNRTPDAAIDVPQVTAPEGKQFVGWKAGSQTLDKATATITYNTMKAVANGQNITWVAEYEPIPGRDIKVTIFTADPNGSFADGQTQIVQTVTEDFTGTITLPAIVSDKGYVLDYWMVYGGTNSGTNLPDGTTSVTLQDLYYGFDENDVGEAFIQAYLKQGQTQQPADDYTIVVSFYTFSNNGALADGAQTSVTLNPGDVNIAFPAVTPAAGYHLVGWKQNTTNQTLTGDTFSVSDLSYSDSGEERYVGFEAVFEPDVTNVTWPVEVKIQKSADENDIDVYHGEYQLPAGEVPYPAYIPDSLFVQVLAKNNIQYNAGDYTVGMWYVREDPKLLAIRLVLKDTSSGGGSDDDDDSTAQPIAIAVNLNGGSWYTGGPSEYVFTEDMSTWLDPRNYVQAPSGYMFSGWKVGDTETVISGELTYNLLKDYAVNGVITLVAQYSEMGPDLG